jgi:diacylglycerol kinase
MNPMSVPTKILRGLRHAIRGLREAYALDRSIRIEVGSSLFFLAFAVFFWPLRTTELLFLCLSYLLIFSVELLNTAIEKSLEKLHPEEDRVIGLIKDIACGAVLVTLLFAGLVLGTIVLTHLGVIAE